MGQGVWTALTRCARAALAVGSALAVISFGFPPDHRLHVAIYLSVTAIATVAALLGIAINQPQVREPWLYLAAGQFCALMAEALWFNLEPSQAPGLADIFFLSVYPLLGIGTILLVRARTPGRNSPAMLDMSLVLVASTTVAASINGGWLAGYLLLDLCLFALVARLVVSRLPRNCSLALICLSFVALGLADSWDALNGAQNAGGNPQNAMWLTSYLLLAAATVHPSMRTATDPEPPADTRIGMARLAILSTLAFAPLATMYGLKWVGRPIQLELVALGTALLLSLLMGRVALLIRTTRHLTERQSERRFLALVEHTTDVVLVASNDGAIRYASPSVERALGYRASDLRGRFDPALIHHDDHKRLMAAIHSTLTRAIADSVQVDGRVRHANGQWRCFEAVLVNLTNHPDVGGIMITARDTTERDRLEQELYYRALHDPLTGLPNRVMLLEQLTACLDHAAEGQSPAAAVLFIDLDDFKTINDGLGHDRGDELLVVLADRLRACVGLDQISARFGGDEFAILLRAPAVAERAETLARSVLREFSRPVTVGDSVVNITASAGIVLAEPPTSPEVVLRNADMAMYAAKAGGKARFEIFDQSMHERALERFAIKARLNSAIEAGQMELLYQPIVELASGRRVGCEALARWNDPTRGFLPPAEFISIAEETGVIVPLGCWALETACAAAAAWPRPAASDPLVVHVNLSVVQLHDPDVVEHVAGALSHSGLEPWRLVLELTESVLLSETEATTRNLKRLKRLGVGLAIDDFGSGYSSLCYLDRLPVDVVKIDKSLISLLGRKLSEKTLARDLVALVRNQGVQVIAEGIERKDQLEALIELGCPLGQGFLFSRPMPAEQVNLLAELGRFSGLNAMRPVALQERLLPYRDGAFSAIDCAEFGLATDG